jgi:hypothetical protein
MIDKEKHTASKDNTKKITPSDNWTNPALYNNGLV